MVPLHHRTKYTESGEKSPPVPPPPPQRGKGEDAPFKNCAKNGAWVGFQHIFSPVLHGGDVTVCPARDRGTHRRRWRKPTCACRGEDRGGGTGEERGDGAGG